MQVTGVAFGAPRRLSADATGAYTIPSLKAGVYSLRFEHAGYAPLVLSVRVPEHASVHLDVTLGPEPSTMQTVRVLARHDRERVEPPDKWSAYQPWRLSGEQLRSTPRLGFPDVTRAVTMSSAGQVTPESGGGLRLQGGATSHTLLMLDGIPLYNAIHVGRSPSALDPDAVAAINVYGEPPASEGGRVGGVVDVRTRANLPDSEYVRSSIWPGGARALTAIPFRGGSTLFSARLNQGSTAQGTTEGQLPRSGNAFATASIPLARGNLTGMVFVSRDGISLDASAGESDNASGETQTTPLPKTNRLAWSSSAGGLTWRLNSDRRSIEAKAWRSGTSTSGNWVPTAFRSQNLASAFEQMGLESSVAWRSAQSATMIGAGLQHLSGEYDVLTVRDSTGPFQAYARMRSGAKRLIASAFLEHSRRVGDRLAFTFGQRAASLHGGGLLFEPRLAATFTANGMIISGAFARTHQFTQSLYNDESLLDAIASLEIPVLAGNDGIPVASSNSVSGKLTLPVGASGLLTLGGFARSFHGIVMAGPGGAGPFAADSFRIGGGSAYGAGIALREQIGRLSLEGAYSGSGVFREKSEEGYRPAFAPGHNLMIAAGYQLGTRTTLRASGLFSALRSTSPVVGSLGWAWEDALTSQREVTGSPQYSAATFGAGRLPPYLRVDVGVRHDMNFGVPLAGKATLFANIDNLFDRRNAIGMAQTAIESARRPLPALPRSFSLGLAVRF